MEQLYGLIGYPLEHSFSEKYFKGKFKKEKIEKIRYLNFPLKTIEELPSLVNDHPYLLGLNVTIPYKEKVIPFLDNLDPVAAKVGAVNTIRISREDERIILTGYNTDVFGFEAALLENWNPSGKKAIVLGSGGAAKAVLYVLKKLNITATIVSRKLKGPGILSYKQLNRELLLENLLIINATPLGMFPAIDLYPSIPYHFLTERHFLFDLIYNPPQTQFLYLGQKQGARVCNGQKMLEKQAEGSWDIWRK